MKKVFLLVTIASTIVFSSCRSNEKRAERAIDDIFTCIAWMEGNEGENVYWCGARWTAPYGVTTDENNKLFKRGEYVDKDRAKELSKQHLREQVFPFLKYVDVRLKKREIISVACFIYNVGGEQFSGYRLDGSLARRNGRIVPPSEFLQAINRGEKPEDVVNYMTGFRKSGGRRANGLLKRHWVTGGIYLGEISVDDIKKCRPKSFYETKNLGNYYWLDADRKLVQKGGYYKLRYDKISINTFEAMNFAKDGQRTVADII